MRIDKFWSLALLIAFTFSIVHEFAYAALDDDRCSVQEYVHELDQPSDHGDMCDTHFEFHTAYLLPDRVELPFQIDKVTLLITDKKTHLSKNSFDLYKPPIS